MALVSAADYQVLRDGGKELGAGEDHSEQLVFKVRSNFGYKTGRRNYAVLNFNIRPSQDARLTVKAIGSGPVTIINNLFFSQSHTRMHQEAFDLTEIIRRTNDSIGTPIGNLLIEFSVRDGPVTLSDIVIHYRVNG